jgi:hypothetical protein
MAYPHALSPYLLSLSLSHGLMAACDMALLLATALSVLDKATHTITHEDELEYSSNADTLSILPADTVGVYTFLQNVYQERAQSPLPLIDIPNGTPKRLAAYPIDARKHKLMRVSASSHGLPPPSSGESNPTTRWTGPFSKTRPSTKQVPRKGKDSYRHPRHQRGLPNAGPINQPMLPRRAHPPQPMPPMPPIAAHNDADRHDARQRELQAPQGLRLVDLAMAADVYRCQQDVLASFDHHRCVICDGQHTHASLLECPSIPTYRRQAVREVVRNRGKYKKFSRTHGLQAAVHSFSINPRGPQ